MNNAILESVKFLGANNYNVLEIRANPKVCAKDPRSGVENLDFNSCMVTFVLAVNYELSAVIEVDYFFKVQDISFAELNEKFSPHKLNSFNLARLGEFLEFLKLKNDSIMNR